MVYNFSQQLLSTFQLKFSSIICLLQVQFAFFSGTKFTTNSSWIIGDFQNATYAFGRRFITDDLTRHFCERTSAFSKFLIPPSNIFGFASHNRLWDRYTVNCTDRTVWTELFTLFWEHKHLHCLSTRESQRPWELLICRSQLRNKKNLQKRRKSFFSSSSSEIQIVAK